MKKKVISPTHITVDLKDLVSFKDLELNKLSIMVGANGTGKTLVLKFNFYLLKCCQFLLSGIPYENLFSSFLESTFRENDFTGTIGMKFDDNKSFINIELENGKINKVSGSFDDDTTVPNVSYLSSNTRNFSFFRYYLSRRSAVNELVAKAETSPLSEEEKRSIIDMEKEFYSYDIDLIEKWIHSSPYVVGPELKEKFKEFFDKDEKIPSEVYVDLTKCDIIGKFGSTEKSLSTFSAGEQALLIMLISTGI